MMLFAGTICVLIWLGLAFAWHGFWRTDQRLSDSPQQLENWPSVTAVVPARNEADTIVDCLKSLAGQAYAGDLTIIIVNDSSTDDTGQLAREAAVTLKDVRIEVVDALPLADGWAGKMWALDQGIALAAASEPDYYWLVDADIVHQRDVLAKLTSHASRDDLALTSVMVKLKCAGFWEKLLVPAFIFFFALLYPFRAINDHASRIAGAAGGCMLVRRDALEEIGGIAAMCNALIDDCTLARTIKRSGGKIWLGLADDSHNLRRYDTLAPFWKMVVRSAYVQLDYSPVLLALCLAGLIVTFALPLGLIAAAPVSVAGILGLVAFAIMTALYWPTVTYHGLPPAWAISLPVAALLFGAMTLHSAICHMIGHGSSWKGRKFHGQVTDR